MNYRTSSHIAAALLTIIPKTQIHDINPIISKPRWLICDNGSFKVGGVKEFLLMFLFIYSAIY